VPKAWVVAKHFWRTPPPAVVGLLASVRTRRFGETAAHVLSPTAETLRDAGRSRMPVRMGPGRGRRRQLGGRSPSTGLVRPDHVWPISTWSPAPRRCSNRLVFAVLVNPQKGAAILSTEERLNAIREAVDECCPADVAVRIDVESFDGLTVDFCRHREATFIVRGLRAISDFESELQMAHTNRKLAPEVDTVFFMTALEHSYPQLESREGDSGFWRRRDPDGAAGLVRRLVAPERGL